MPFRGLLLAALLLAAMLFAAMLFAPLLLAALLLVLFETRLAGGGGISFSGEVLEVRLPRGGCSEAGVSVARFCGY